MTTSISNTEPSAAWRSLPTNEIIIEKRGFRPSDWVDRIAALPGPRPGAGYVYAPDCYPRYVDGRIVLAVRPEMATTNRAHFEWLLDFVLMHGLNLHIDRRLADTDPSGFSAVLGIIKGKGLAITWR